MNVRDPNDKLDLGRLQFLFSDSRENDVTEKVIEDDISAKTLL